MGSEVGRLKKIATLLSLFLAVIVPSCQATNTRFIINALGNRVMPLTYSTVDKAAPAVAAPPVAAPPASRLMWGSMIVNEDEGAEQALSGIKPRLKCAPQRDSSIVECLAKAAHESHTHTHTHTHTTHTYTQETKPNTGCWF
jgi:hypothetical protein